MDDLGYPGYPYFRKHIIESILLKNAGSSMIFHMWVKQCHKPSPSHHHVYRWYYHSQSWLVCGIVS